MTTCVLDAGVAAKWFLPAKDEPLAAEAMELFREYTKGSLRFVVPDLFWCELGNILWKAVRQGRCSPASAEAALSNMLRHKLPTVSAARLVEDALPIAIAFDRTLYDSTYVARALATNSYVVTGDERLANAVAAHLPVRWLGSTLGWS